MPPEFARLQAQDMGKVGAIQDLLRDIEKIMSRTENNKAPKSKVVQVTLDNLIARCCRALENGAYFEANELGQKILDTEAFYYLLLANYQVTDTDTLFKTAPKFYNNRYYIRLTMYAPQDSRTLELQKLEELSKEQERRYLYAQEQLCAYRAGIDAVNSGQYEQALSYFTNISD